MSIADPVICIVDDDEAVRDSLQVLLLTRGLVARTYESATAFLADGGAQDCRCLVLDMHMPGMTGLALLASLRSAGNQVPAIIVTGGADMTLAEQAGRAGALTLLKKPVGEDELFAWVHRAFAIANGHSH